MYAFVKVQGGVGRAFEKHCEQIGVKPADMLASMIEERVAAQNMALPPPEDMGSGLDRLTAIYLKMRKTYQTINREAEAEVDDIKGQMVRLSMELMEALNKAGVDSMKSKSGTFYKQEKIKPSAEDWTVVYKFITDNNRFDLLEKRLTANVVKEYMEEHDAPPPGVKVYREYEVVVRTGKDA